MTLQSTEPPGQGPADLTLLGMGDFGAITGGNVLSEKECSECETEVLNKIVIKPTLHETSKVSPSDV